MPAHSGVSSGYSSRQQHLNNENSCVSSNKQSHGNYEIYCRSAKDIYPAHRGEAKKMSAKELVLTRALFKNLGLTSNP